MLSALAGATLVAAAVSDIRARVIPNVLPLVVAASGLLQATLHGGLAPAAAVAAAFFAVGFAAFAAGLVGGGDAKLLAATGFWIPPVAISDFFTVMALTGAVLASVVLARRAWLAAVSGKVAGGRPSVPYGAAIATGAGFVLLTPV